MLEISLENFKYNIEQIRTYVGEGVKLMPVVKANGYGTHINFVPEIMNEFEIVAVARANEGKALRELGYKNDIFILNQPDIEDLDTIIKNNMTVGLSNNEFLEEAIKQQVSIKVHLEIETGMGRTGIAVENLENYISKIVNAENIEVEGIYTHFSVADVDKDYTNAQIEKFKTAVEIAQKSFTSIKYVHSSASNGILNFKDAKFNLVRPGIIMYGYEPFEGAYEKMNLKPIAKLKAKINFVKEINAEDSISYGRKFIAKEKMKIATIPLGYADGVRREYGEKGEVVINGKRAKIVGTICMDSFMVDVTNIPDVAVGNEAYIWDNENITLDEVAEKCGTINYEILSTISDRVPRKFI